ncbi:NAD(P)H dehydrogenase (quinone) [Mucilaginibacter mallensis]|uniref:NAD(P)H dehydrogenase (Quinone) n=1 Tax=Mucilaginibacter mallensis TaxID=652787 RepID=A0A1H2CCP3_MUCMA|nr:SDR family oxidoreductase [Mucilaginibacter mallensis]SDT68221.1 NAD(P)H dehydrogenase (quinone) [Mucilaginibacter mallensis]
MILITGATGKMGGIVIETMLKNGISSNQIAALVRDEDKATALKAKGIDVRIGDYDNRHSLDEAMKGIDKVLLVSGLDTSKLVEQHRNVTDAAKGAGVKCLAYTSNCLKDRETLVNNIMRTHFETEDLIIGSGMNYLIFRNVLYMDSMAGYMLGKDVLEKGINLPAGDGRVSYALRSDEAEAIGNVLSTDNCASRIFNFTNTRTYSFEDVANALSELCGKTVTYTPLTMDIYIAEARTKGVPEHALEMIAPFYTDIANGQGSTVSTDLEEALGRKPVDLKSGLKLLLNL